MNNNMYIQQTNQVKAKDNNQKQDAKETRMSNTNLKHKKINHNKL